MSHGAFETAIQVLLRCRQGLAGDPTPDERARLLALLEATAELLAASGRQRLRTAALAERVQRLEAQLQDRDPGERRAIICERLGISRSRFYELRQSPENSGLARGML
jgi:hypothetical protein